MNVTVQDTAHQPQRRRRLGARGAAAPARGKADLLAPRRRACFYRSGVLSITNPDAAVLARRRPPPTRPSSPLAVALQRGLGPGRRVRRLRPVRRRLDRRLRPTRAVDQRGHLGGSGASPADASARVAVAAGTTLGWLALKERSSDAARDCRPRTARSTWRPTASRRRLRDRRGRPIAAAIEALRPRFPHDARLPRRGRRRPRRWARRRLRRARLPRLAAGVPARAAPRRRPGAPRRLPDVHAERQPATATSRRS